MKMMNDTEMEKKENIKIEITLVKMQMQNYIQREY